MRAGLIIILLSTIFTFGVSAQKECATYNYQQEILSNYNSFRSNVSEIENFIRQQIQNPATASRTGDAVIRIPVVVHILYHTQNEKVSDQQVFDQLEVLNTIFRRRNADTVKTPAAFRPLAADCEIEFRLATSDPQRRSTSGIIKKYTPVTSWTADDKMKFSSEMGDDAWDTKSYLNIWVCNMDRLAGYSSFPGGPANLDGIVMDIDAFGLNSSSAYGMGKTAVHEAGHWLGLKHLWGDALCGDDGVSDTPKQAGYTPGCPTGARITCGNGPNGDMYMNYMDFTSDACMNLFTLGQKARMQALFANGGVRHGIVLSKGLDAPLILNAPLPEQDPKWLHPQLFPNPATTQMTLDLVYDPRWIGKILRITNQQGQNVMSLTITSKTQQIDISRLKPGVYILAAKKDDGESILQRFIKL